MMTKRKGFSGMMQRRTMVAADDTGGTSDLAYRINHGSMGNITFSGRGHGRKTPHGRGPKRDGPRATKRDMLYFVRDTVRTWRTMNHVYDGPIFLSDGNGTMKTSTEWANFMVNKMQFFDCSEIEDYVLNNVTEMYHEDDVPPHPDAILPAPAVGLYIPTISSLKHESQGQELMHICVPMVGAEETRDAYTVYTLVRGWDGHIMRGPLGVGNINIPNGTFDTHHFDNYDANENEQRSATFSMRFVCGLLQTINTPRFVVAGKRDVSLVKRQSFKKAAGRFTPDSWNMVSWNIEAPVKAKDNNEGTGGRQALHFRRGYWRKAEKDWERSRWSETRNRWEQYIHGYEAGHPAFGVKKSYHLPRKE